MFVDKLLKKYHPEYEEDLYEPLRKLEQEKNNLEAQVTLLKKEIFLLKWMLEEHD